MALLWWYTNTTPLLAEKACAGKHHCISC
jgi:hypothetical protein